MKRLSAAIAGLVALVVSFSVPYQTTYAYMEEFRFLLEFLPRHRAKILTIWDPACPGGDYDCCLSLPYPSFAGDYPNLVWQVLEKKDADRSRLDNLEFDYYYPGSLVGIDIERLNTWFIGRHFGDPELNRRQQEPLRALQAIDAYIRSNYDLELVSAATVPAHTFGFAPFPDERMTLRLYRRGSPERFADG